MATLEKSHYSTSNAASNAARTFHQAVSDGYNRSAPRILTEDFAHELAAANRERRAERCPWLERNLARLSEMNVPLSPRHGAGMSSTK
ncbi:MAG TPA: hypothetical protein VIT92_01185 [Burkholderiaceae bacterium]